MKKLAVLKDSMDLGDLHLFKQLADKSRDLSQDEKKITVVKPEEIHKITIIFTQNGCHFLNLLIFGDSYFHLSLR